MKSAGRVWCGVRAPADGDDPPAAPSFQSTRTKCEKIRAVFSLPFLGVHRFCASERREFDEPRSLEHAALNVGA